jgi:hypothetical protein
MAQIMNKLNDGSIFEMECLNLMCVMNAENINNAMAPDAYRINSLFPDNKTPQNVSLQMPTRSRNQGGKLYSSNSLMIFL